MKIMIPQKISNDFDGINKLLKIYDDLYKTDDLSSVVFDFENNIWFEANLVTMFATIFQNLVEANENIPVYFENVSSEVEEIFFKNGFYEFFKLGSKFDTFNSTIPFKVFKGLKEDIFSEYVEEQVVPKIQIRRTDEEKRMFKTCLEEIYQNTRMHSNCAYFYTCGQYFYKSKYIAFTMVDLGITIGENVRGKLKYDIPDQDAIEWATIFGNTTKIDGDGGIGLSMLKEYVENNGNLIIVSGNGYWEVEKGKEVFKRTLKYTFHGTMINIITNLKYTKVKVDKEEVLF